MLYLFVICFTFCVTFCRMLFYGVGACGFFDGIDFRGLLCAGGIKAHCVLSLLFLLSVIWVICHGAIFLDFSHVALVVGGGLELLFAPLGWTCLGIRYS